MAAHQYSVPAVIDGTPDYSDGFVFLSGFKTFRNMDISETIKFRDVCAMLDRIKNSNLPSKEKYLRRYYESFLKHRQVFRKEHGIDETAEEIGSSSFYSVLRCIIPGADSARVPYGMQITSLGKIYIKVLQIPSDSQDAQRLHARSYSGIRGDYAEIVRSVLQPRVQRDPSNFTLKEIHTMLDIIAEDDRRNTEKVLTELLEKSPASEQMWFIRLLLKSMHLGVGEHRVLSILHPQAKELYQRCTNLLRVCCLLADNKLTTLVQSEMEASSSKTSFELNLNAAIVPFQHIRPMLCEIFPGDITPLMASDVLYMETKMDGERFQLHFVNGRYKYISRNGKDYTAGFGEDYSNGNLTPYLRDLMPIGVNSIIIDGEMMVWDERQKKYRDKGENTDVKHLSSGGDSTWRPCFVAYDLLYLDGETMLDVPYVQRVYKLTCLLTEKEGVLRVMKPIKVSSLDEFQNLFQAALDKNQEGVVVKKQKSVYRPGVRNGGGWYKIKADYIEGLTQEFDLLIIGGFYNRQRTWIESFLLGVLAHEDSGRFDVYSVAKVANITRQRSIFNEKLKPHWHDILKDPAPLWYHYMDRSPEGRPDVWIEPSHSFILQVRAADLTNSTAFALPKCLHFPRIVRYRQDKDWLECLTLQEFRQLYQGIGRNLKKINKRQLKTEDFTTNRKRHKLTAADKRKLGMLAYERKINPDEIERVSNLLSGYEICVLSAALMEGITPEEVKIMVIRNGGEIAENPIYTNPKCITVAGDLTYRVERLIKTKFTDVVNVNWLVQSCVAGEIQKLRPCDMICTTETLKEVFAENYDQYGDSYDTAIDAEELKNILDNISDEQLDSCDTSESDMEQLQRDLKIQNFSFTQNGSSYFFGISRRLELAKLLYQCRSGRCVENVDNEIDLNNLRYIFIDKAELVKSEFMKWLQKYCKPFLKNLEVVNIDWVIDSHQAQEKLDIREYTWHDF